MTKLSQEEINFAKRIGATHYYEGSYWKSGGDYTGAMRWKDGEWVFEQNYWNVTHECWNLDKIDFSGPDGFSWPDFQIAVERLVDHCNGLGMDCDQLDLVERMLKEM